MHKTQQVDYPLVFFSLAFFIILLGLFSKLTFQKRVEQQNGIPQTTSSTKTPTKKLNYNDPVQCTFTSPDSSISAQLEGTTLSALISKKNEKRHVVVQGDCMYSWVEGILVGQKQCAIGQYMSIAKQLLGSGLASPESLGDMAKQMGKNIPIDIVGVMRGCKNVMEVKKDSFLLPKSIQFK